MVASRALVAWGCALALGCQLVLPLHQETEPADDAGSPPPADAPAALGCDAGILLNPTCESCISTSCCPALGACLANPQCVAIINCMEGCPPFGFACDQTCATEHTNGEQDYASVEVCLSNSCKTQCQ